MEERPLSITDAPDEFNILTPEDTQFWNKLHEIHSTNLAWEKFSPTRQPVSWQESHKIEFIGDRHGGILAGLRLIF